MSQTVDPIKAEVIARHLLATSEEMGAALLRTAFSPNIKERADCSSAIFDAQGQVVALAHRVPVHLGSMVGIVETLRQRYDLNTLRPGDMFAANDPYHGGGSHLPDISVLAPVFMNGEIVAYVANIAHHADVGGMVPGSEAAVCQTIFQEGLRIPLVQIMHAGKVNRDLLDLISLNSRTPQERLGDMQAQFAANHVGVHGVTALFERYGLRQATAHMAAYLDFTEKRFRAAIDRLPAGTYVDQDELDGDTTGSTVAIRLALTVGDGQMHFDFTGSGPQLNSARNIPYRALLATIYTVAKSMLDPEVPANAGYYRTITQQVPKDSVVGPTPPAAVGARSISCGVLGDVIAGCLSQAIPDKALARSGPHHLLVLSGMDPRTHTYFVDYETVAGGMGARPYHDGMDAVRVHASGASNLPVEALEHVYPLRIEQYALRDDSAGAGRYRGGLGVVRDYRILADDIQVSLSSERQHVAARGMAGGAAGATGEFVINPGQSDERKLPAAAADIALPRNTVLSVRTPAGGGFGKPEQRDPQLIERDLREGRVLGAL
ncbi:MAG: hydantoinase B/oxoprolinase family protein [bacterium]|nr:hydantoinase B/oxoprolinase family protein [bacterium]